MPDKYAPAMNPAGITGSLSKIFCVVNLREYSQMYTNVPHTKQLFMLIEEIQMKKEEQMRDLKLN
jgi:hypothetical protein